MSESTAVPRPRRRKWLRRLVILGCCVLALLVVWGVLNLWMGSQFQREVEALRARGEPTSLAEMAPTKPLPREQDAAVLIRRAIAIYDANVDPLLKELEAAVNAGYSNSDTPSPGGWWSLSFDATFPADHPELMDEFASHVAAIRDAAGPVVERLRKARDLESYDMGVDFAAPLDQALPDVQLPKTRALAKLCVLLAADAHRRGDDAAAVQHFRDLFPLSRHAVQYPTLISELVAMSVEYLAEAENPRVLPELRLDREPARTTAKELMALLLDPNRPRERRIRCMKGERAFSCTETGAALSGTASQSALAGYQNPFVSNPVLRALCRPALGSDAAAYLRSLSSVVAAAGEDDYPSASAKLDFPPIPQSKIGQALHPFTTMGMSYTTALKFCFRRLAASRMAGAAIAVRMYELDKGRPLARLEDLVPEYLPALPKDPSDPNGGPIRMGRWGGRELLYSVGAAGEDLGGRYAMDANETRGSAPDQYNWPHFLRGDGPRERIYKRTPQTGPAIEEVGSGGMGGRVPLRPPTVYPPE